jgi:hypothetical protein
MANANSMQLHGRHECMNWLTVAVTVLTAVVVAAISCS